MVICFLGINELILKNYLERANRRVNHILVMLGVKIFVFADFHWKVVAGTVVSDDLQILIFGLNRIGN
jgi:hypothetical protein